MGNPLARAAHIYGPTALSGYATALIGDNHGSIQNIQQANIFVNSGPSLTPESYSSKVVRQNHVFHTYTIETITAFRDGGPVAGRGTASTISLHWHRREHLGSGMFGEVHREEHYNAAGMAWSRAVKVLRRRQLERLKIDYKRELNALIQLSHPDYVHMFVEFYSWYEAFDSIFLAMEFVPFGDLEAYIARHGHLTENYTAQIGCQVLEGLRAMHRLDLVHRDIKPANIFVIKPSPLWWVKIGDFGICKSTITQHTSLHSQVGTSGYQAPEVLGLVATEKHCQYNAKCDVWSLGCLLFAIITSEIPFLNIGALTQYCYDRTNFPSSRLRNASASQQALEFIVALLQPNPGQRPTAEEAADIGIKWLDSASKLPVKLTPLWPAKVAWDTLNPNPQYRAYTAIPRPPSIFGLRKPVKKEQRIEIFKNFNAIDRMKKEVRSGLNKDHDEGSLVYRDNGGIRPASHIPPTWIVAKGNQTKKWSNGFNKAIHAPYFFGQTTVKKPDERLDMVKNFSPFDRLKKEASTGSRKNVVRANGGILPSYFTPPIWEVAEENRDKVWDDLFHQYPERPMLVYPPRNTAWS